MRQHTTIELKNIHIRDGYWDRYIRLIPEKVLPYQWQILNDNVPDAPASYCLQNFRIAAKEAEGERQGTVFQDSDVAKWLEALAYTLETNPDPALEQQADEVIDLICRAQQPDGYLDTYYTLVEPENRWQNLCEGHELYCAGHLIEAAVAYYYATGKRKLLDCVCRMADLIAKTFGPAPAQLHGYPGHPEIELALVKLYHATGTARYLDTAVYFIDARGTEPNIFLEQMKRRDFRHIFIEFKDWTPEYAQSHLPVRRQTTAEGHAVRAVYLYCAMADIAAIKHDDTLLTQCKILWNNMVHRRMFITGGIGSSGHLERFTADYDLPNDTNYSETCASIGLALFGFRMAHITHDASYIDICERALYNTVRAGISLEGNRYFYVNPLEVWPDICLPNTSRSHVKAVRQKWFDVACCPTNIARTFASLGQYIYDVDEDNLYVNLFIQNESVVSIGGLDASISLVTDYPKTGSVAMLINAPNASFALHLRKPAFAKNYSVLVNGESCTVDEADGYCTLKRVWGSADRVEISFAIEPKLVFANPLVRANCGKVAILRGPEVYCLEECDNGTDLAAVYIDSDVQFSEEWRQDLLGGTMLVHCCGKKLRVNEALDDAVSETPPLLENVSLTAVPYGSWGNRKEGEMIVWLHTITK